MTTTESMIEAERDFESAEGIPPLDEDSAPIPLDELKAELAQTVNHDLDAGFESAVALATEVLGGKLLFTLPAAGLVQDAMRVAPVCLSSGNDQTIVFVVLNASGQAARVEGGEGEMADIARFACSFVDVIGRLRDFDFAEAQAA